MSARYREGPYDDRLVRFDGQGEPADPTKVPWRVGESVGRTIYAVQPNRRREQSDHDVLIGTMDSRALARAAVEAHNAALEGEQ